MRPLDPSLICEHRYDGESTYGREVGHFVMPNGSLLAISHEVLSDPINRALVAAAWDAWKEARHDL